MPALHPLDAIYTRHHGWLVNWLRKRLGSGGDAADLAHDTFVRLLSKPREFDSKEGERAWLSTVAHGLCVDLWRRRQIEQAWLEALASRPEPLHPSPERSALAMEALLAIDAMLRALPERAARAFLLSQLEGLTYGEIALRLGVSDRTIKKDMAQAMLHCIVLEAASAQEARVEPAFATAMARGA